MGCARIKLYNETFEVNKNAGKKINAKFSAALDNILWVGGMTWRWHSYMAKGWRSDEQAHDSSVCTDIPPHIPSESLKNVH